MPIDTLNNKFGTLKIYTASAAESASELSAPVLAEVGGVHNLLAEDAESASEVSQPTLTEIGAMIAGWQYLDTRRRRRAGH